MSDAKEEAKAKKKLAKEQSKAAKKLAKVEEKTHETPHAASSTSMPAPAPISDGISPAERSARAAEQQVRLQRFRVWFAFLTVLLTLATILITLRPWRWLDREPAATDPPAVVNTENP
jgi:hypothetical protein